MVRLEFPENYKELFTPSKEETKQKDVFVKFYEWTLRKLFPSDTLSDILFDNREILDIAPPGKRFSIMCVSVCQEEEERLKELFIAWARKAHKKTIKRAKEAYMWHNLDIGPRTVEKSEEFQPGYIYVDLERLWEPK